MKKITITERKQAELLGILYAEYEILSSEQMSIVKQQMDKPSYDYNCELNSLWAFYNHVTHALKKAHPRDWMDDQRKLHWFIAIEFDLVNFIEDGVLLPMDELELNYGEPENQLNILTEIEKAEEIEELTQIAEDREQAERDIVFYEDPAGNTFEAPVVDDIKIHIESDEEYNARVAEIEGEPEVIEPEKLSLDDILIRIPNAEKKALEEALEVEEVKPTETKIVDDWGDEDFNFDLDDIKKDDHGGEFFL